MVTLDAWVMLLLLLGMMLVAFVPGVRKRVNRLGLVRQLGERSIAVVDREYGWLMLLVLVIGVGVRLFRFPELPRGLYMDSAMTAAESLSLLREGTDQFGTSWPVHFEAWGYGQQSILLGYLMIPCFALFGVSKVTIALPMLVVSLLALPVMWDFSRRILGKRFALLMLFLLAINPGQIVQSRWSLDCNMMAHFLLFSMYFLFLGLEKRPLLYLSMIFFGLTMYAYGVALYTVPFLLVAACIYLLRKGRIRWWEALLCAVLFLLVSGPFLITMAINFFGWPTLRLGPFTMQFFEKTTRSNDILLFSEEPYAQFVRNLKWFLAATLFQNEGDTIAAYFSVKTLYTFSVPLILSGIFLVWRGRRAGLAGPQNPGLTQRRREDGLSLMFLWVVFMTVCGVLTNYTTSQRSNAIFYALLFCMGYAMYLMVRHVKALLPLLLVLYLTGFGIFCAGYFGDVSYIERTGFLAYDGLYEALLDVREMDCDTFYIYSGDPDNVSLSEGTVIVAHELDSKQLADEKPVPDHLGELSDLYYPYRYVYTDFSDFEPDPMECAAYVIRQEHKDLFPWEDYLIEDFGLFASVYPRYWAEE